MKKPEPKSAAVLTIRRASDMTPKGRREIARWLDQQKGFLLKNPGELAARYTARYLYT